MNTKTFATIKELEINPYIANHLNSHLEQGWHYIGYKLKREVQSDGSFEEEFIHLLGHESKNP